MAKKENENSLKNIISRRDILKSISTAPLLLGVFAYDYLKKKATGFANADWYNKKVKNKSSAIEKYHNQELLNFEMGKWTIHTHQNMEQWRFANW